MGHAPMFVVDVLLLVVAQAATDNAAKIANMNFMVSSFYARHAQKHQQTR
jgi:hypothetical protein